MITTHIRSKHSTTRKDASKTEQILFRVTPERKRQLRMILAERGQSIQTFVERSLEAALAQAQKEKN
jgi:hypothetical protein